MTIDEAIKMYTSNAEYERTHGSLQGCMDFKQLAEWLKDYKRLLEQKPCNDMVSRGVFEQVMWERDIAIEQLKELGYELGENVNEEQYREAWKRIKDELVTIAEGRTEEEKLILVLVNSIIDKHLKRGTE